MEAEAEEMYDWVLRANGLVSALMQKTVLTIAGYDPSSGAGVTADLMVFAAHGLFGTSCITGLTVQSTVGVRSTYPVAAKIVAETLDCLESDLPPAGIKIGMLTNAANVYSISDYLNKYQQTLENDRELRRPIVLDPVLRSSSGRELLDKGGVEVLRNRLLPLVDWITPNLDELSVLTGERVAYRSDLPGAARALQEQAGAMRDGRRLGVFATGGHLDPPDDYQLMPDGEGVWLPGERIETQSTHGTGCALSSAFLSRLVLGESPQEAALGAKTYVAKALRRAIGRGSGNSAINHLWAISKA
jgi:hydroxymethylpyrimidine/phosphomethylpyrimidine kinase